ncbi:hypothetical protein N5923_11890 [Erwiniaceae bacterium BAC15a-03b]|uniref:Uncharacterized protein n=1 Tax=Winslowiella arboricola TaxID=2978220 RepID=A0A9J6PVY6_9GAMM|nr:hypothetical protein [Winslowiella arboricola]MCU5771442.1 hypothetical protein [Winslowiella arboricola]MCU5778191.1 hypothetical protein [Winslowiella arboricola]
MLYKAFQQRLHHCQKNELAIREAKPDRLRQIQDELNNSIHQSTGMFTFTIPLVLSTFFMILSLAIAQYSLWEMVTRFLQLPSTTTLILVVISSVVCAILYIIPLFVMTKGYMIGVKVHIWLAWFTLLMAGVYFVNYLLCAITSETGFIAPLLSLAFIIFSFVIICSERFYYSLLFALWCRVMRKLAIVQRYA